MTRGAGLCLVERKPLVIEKVAAEFDLLLGHGIVGRHVGKGKTGRQIPLVRAELGFFDGPLTVAQRADILHDLPALGLAQLRAEHRHAGRYSVAHHPIDLAIGHGFHQVFREIRGPKQKLGGDGGASFAIGAVASGTKALIERPPGGSLFVRSGERRF